MSEHEFVFGDVPCLIIVEGAAPATASVFQWLGERDVQRLGDRQNPSHPVELVASAAVDALSRAVRYLEDRFGAVTKGPGWLGKHAIRTVIDEPIRDERAEP